MKSLKKFNINSLEGTKLSSSELKHFIGGYGDIELDEVVILCGRYSGQCWKYLNDDSNDCHFTGVTTDSCYF